MSTNSSIFQQVKQSTNCFDLVQELGLTPNRAGMIRCPSPAHRDETPSCKVYSDSLFCFGCGKRFSAIDLVMLNKNISALDAARWLAARAGVPLSHGKSGDKVTKRRPTTEKANKINASGRKNFDTGFAIDGGRRCQR